MPEPISARKLRKESLRTELIINPIPVQEPANTDAEEKHEIRKLDVDDAYINNDSSSNVHPSNADIILVTGVACIPKMKN